MSRHETQALSERQEYSKVRWKTSSSCRAEQTEDCRALGNSRGVRKGLDLQHPTSSESCRSSMFDYEEKMTLVPPRKRPEWPVWKEARGRQADAWRLEAEGETEVPETVIVADEKTTMDEEKSKITEVKVTCQEEGEEIKSPKRK